MNSISHPSIGWNFAENQHLCKSVLLGHGSCHQVLVAFPVTSISQTHCLLCVPTAAAATPVPGGLPPLGLTPPSYLRPASQVTARPRPRLRRSLRWKPVCGSPLPAGSSPTSLRSHSSALPGLPQGTLFPRRLTPHASLISPPHYAPAPTVFPGPQQTSTSPTSSLQCPLAPLHTPTPACCPGQILGLTCPGSPRALLQAELAFPRGSPVPCAGLFGKSEPPVCLLSSEAGLYVPRERPGQTDNRHNPRERSPSVSPGPSPPSACCSLPSVYTLVPNS